MNIEKRMLEELNKFVNEEMASCEELKRNSNNVYVDGYYKAMHNIKIELYEFFKEVYAIEEL